jgi:exosortase
MHTSAVDAPQRLSLPRLTVALAAAPVLALIWTYWPVLPGLVAQWWDEPEYSHAFLVPIVSGYLAWSKQEELARAAIRPSYWGLALMGLALLVYVTGKVGAELFLQRFSLVVMLAGVVLYVAGPRVLAILAFPLGFLLLMIPLPGIVFNSIAFPLQLLAAQASSVALEAVGVPVFREGNVMHLAAASLDVEEACSGIRSLLSLTALGVLYSHLAFTTWTPRILLMLLVAPVAIAANVLRVFVAGLLAHHVSVETALGVFHTAGGWSVFLMAAVLLLGASRGMRALGLAK